MDTLQWELQNTPGVQIHRLAGDVSEGRHQSAETKVTGTGTPFPANQPSIHASIRDAPIRVNQQPIAALRPTLCFWKDHKKPKP